jgi:hypothetical protein
MIHVTRRRQSLLRLAGVALTLAAGACLGGRGRPKTAAPAVVPRAADSTPRDTTTHNPTTAPRPTKGDSTSLAAARAVDSVNAKRVADSVASAAKVTPKVVPKKARTKECLLNTNESPPESRFTYQKQNDSSTTLMWGGGFVGRCEGEKNLIKADSAEYFQQNGFVNLFGNVTYEEGTEFRVTANHATYFTQDGKLYADGNVVATQLKTGSTFRGPNIEYFRVMPNLRDVSRLYAPNSPNVEIVQKDSLGKPLPPVRINASVMQDAGDSVLFAWGSVSILRTDITGRSDSASYNKATGNSRLIRGAQIVSVAKDQQFTLSGDTIDLFSQDSVLNRVLAQHLSRAKSGDITMAAERIDLRLVDKKIDRAYVSGFGRSKADMPRNSLEADSMDIRLPGQRIEELRAFGRAVALSRTDSLKIRSDERDELHGDTVIAVFDTLRNPKDTAAKATLRVITAGGNASSKVQIASRQGPTFPPAINYVKGKHLIVQFDSGQVRNIEVDSSAYGNYFEPVTDSVVDSTKKKPAKKPPGRGGRGGASLGAANALVIPREPYDDGRGARNVLVLPTAFRRPE